jgi:hypothetical protein
MLEMSNMAYYETIMSTGDIYTTINVIFQQLVVQEVIH